MSHRVRISSIAIATVALLATALPAAAIGDPVVEDPPSPPAQATRANGWCSLAGDGGSIELRNCRLAGDGSVKVIWNDPELIDAAAADALIASTQEAMSRYKALGFSAASISGLNRVDIAVLPGDASPYYSWKLGNVNISAGSAKKLTSNETSARLELWHELFHWIQDENYVMAWASLNGDLKWWIETTAELGTFLIDDAALDHNAVLYGNSTVPDTVNHIMQIAPHQWVGNEQYLQAQRLVSAMCPGCAFSQEALVKAVNAGTYPFDDNGIRARFNEAIEAYARYVLTGTSSQFGTSATMASGGKIGEYVVLSADKGAPWKVWTNGFKPQINDETGAIEAPLEANSIYPLLVANGAGGEKATGSALPAGDPAMLRIAPGPELWYTIDGGEVQHHGGAAELVLGPLHPEYGLGEVRIVAATRLHPATFKASFEPISLEGDWVFTIAGKGKTIKNTCPSDSASLTAGGDDLLEMITSFAATKGTYHANGVNGAQDQLLWIQQKPFRISPKDPEARYDAELILGDKEVAGSFELVLPKTKSASSSDGIVAAMVDMADGTSPGFLVGVLAAFIPLGLVPLVRRRRQHLSLVALLVMGGVVAGCVPGFTIDGSIGGDLHFTTLEWNGAAKAKAVKQSKNKTGKAAQKAKQKAKGMPEWILKGTKSRLSVDLTVTSSIDGKKEKKRCIVELELPISGKLYLDGTVKAPKL